MRFSMRDVLWLTIRQVLLALGLGVSMLVGAFLGAVLFTGPSNGPEESAWQLVEGAAFGVIGGAIAFKALQHQRHIRDWLKDGSSSGPYGNC
jgi:hypothetical protein